MKKHLPAFFIYAAFLVFILSTFRDYGISWDESNYVQQGKLYSETLFDPFLKIDTTTNNLAANHAPFFDLLYFSTLEAFSLQENYEALHLLKAIVASFTLLFIYFSVKSLTQNINTSLFTMFFLIFSPRWLGDIFDNQLDITAALFYSIEILVAINLLKKSSDKNLWKWIILFAVISGLSFSQRTALAVVPIVTLGLLIYIYLKKHHLPLLKLVLSFLLFGAFFYFSQYMTDPLISNDGLKGIVRKITISLNPHAITTLFEGKMLTLSQVPRHYHIEYIGISTPIIILLFLVIGIAFLIYELLKMRDATLLATRLLLLASFFLPIFLVIAVNPKDYDAWRHFLFLVIPLCMIAGIGAGNLLQKKTLAKGFVITLSVLTIVSTVKELIMLHPYEYIYFNELVGGLPGAYGKYETDYWAKSTKEAMLWLGRNTDPTKTYFIYNCTDPFQAAYYFTPNMVTALTSQEADYTICFSRYNMDKQIDGKLLYTVERQGIPLIFVKSAGQNN